MTGQLPEDPGVRTAEDVYRALGTLRFQLEQLAGQGRILMTRDKHNTDHPDSAGAVAAWMETLATPTGGYPVLPDGD